MLVDYRLAQAPEYALMVYGLLDDRDFIGQYLADSDQGREWISVPLPRHHPDAVVPDLKLDSADAEAIHELWSHWNGGVCDDYLLFTHAMADVISQDRVREALSAAIDVSDSSAAAAPTTKKKKKKAVRKRS
ncbi:MAG: hypothetical protein E6R07_07315 [Nevskiaceae bacterium]|nr:MAG: hypothetical protein E6R07_07315 [Nevskiaceae bacterium]